MFLVNFLALSFSVFAYGDYVWSSESVFVFDDGGTFGLESGLTATFVDAVNNGSFVVFDTLQVESGAVMDEFAFSVVGTANVTLISLESNYIVFVSDAAAVVTLYADSYGPSASVSGGVVSGYDATANIWEITVSSSGEVTVYFNSVEPTPTVSPTHTPITSVTTNSASVDFYYWSSTQTVNNQTGYNFEVSEGSAATFVSASVIGEATADFGYAVWVTHFDGSVTQLVSPYSAVVSRSSVGSGFQNGTVAVSSRDLVVGYTGLKVGLYVRFDGGSWVPLAYFVSDVLYYRQVSAATWTFSLYTELAYDGVDTTALAYWGNSSVNSGVLGVVFREAPPQEIGLGLLGSGEWVNSVLYPYAFIIGYDIVWGLIMLFFGVNVYLRYRRMEPAVIMLLLFGGTSAAGGFGMLIPNLAYRFVYILVVLFIAAMLYKVFR
jgi:hypothetical protein